MPQRWRRLYRGQKRLGRRLYRARCPSSVAGGWLEEREAGGSKRQEGGMIRGNQRPILGLRCKVQSIAMDYVHIPSVARRLPPNDGHPTQPHPRIQSSVNPVYSPTEPTSSFPAKTALGILPAMLLASTAGIPTPGSFSGQRGPGTLISTRDPLSIPTTSANFRRFASKVGPIFWLQDRIEEILMWKRGWKVTTVWMAVYTFLCKFLFSRQVCFLDRIYLNRGILQASSRG